MPYFNGGMNSKDNYGETNVVPDDSNEARVKRAAQRTTGSPTGGSPSRSSEAEVNYNYKNAMRQGEKTAFRAHKTALNNDPYNPARMDNAIQQKQAEWGT